MRLRGEKVIYAEIITTRKKCEENQIKLENDLMQKSAYKDIIEMQIWL